MSTKVRRYFDEAACRRGAAFLDEKLQASRSPGEMAGLGVAATALRQAELYDFTVNYLERLPAEALYDALADEAAWQKLYDRVLTESANYTGRLGDADGERTGDRSTGAEPDRFPAAFSGREEAVPGRLPDRTFPMNFIRAAGSPP